VTRKLYATGSATANGASSITIPSSSTLKQVQWAVRFNSITDGAQVDLELSLASAREIQTNAAQQCISQVAFEGNFVTSGLAQTGINLIVPCNVRLTQGQLLYLHALVGGTVVYDATLILWM